MNRAYSGWMPRSNAPNMQSMISVLPVDNSMSLPAVFSPYSPYIPCTKTSHKRQTPTLVLPTASHDSLQHDQMATHVWPQTQNDSLQDRSRGLRAPPAVSQRTCNARQVDQDEVMSDNTNFRVKLNDVKLQMMC